MSDTSSLPKNSPTEQAEPQPLGDREDRRLVQQCAQGDPAALRALVDRYQGRLLRFLRPLLGSPEDAEEAALDVFLRVWQQARRFEGRAAVATWLYRIAANAARDRLRRRQAEERVSARAGAPDPEAFAGAAINPEEAAVTRMAQAERARLLEQAMQTLRVEDRLLLVLYYQEELGYAQIAQITGVPTPVLKMRLLRARRRLRPVLERLTGLEEPEAEETA